MLLHRTLFPSSRAVEAMIVVMVASPPTLNFCCPPDLALPWAGGCFAGSPAVDVDVASVGYGAIVLKKSGVAGAG